MQTEFQSGGEKNLQPEVDGMARTLLIFVSAFSVLLPIATPLTQWVTKRTPIIIPSGAEDGVPPACELALHPVAPNPFGSSTEIRFSSNQSSDATVAVFEVEGRRVWWRRVGAAPDGDHRVVWPLTVEKTPVNRSPAERTSSA
jgi:hypothetical protein